MIKSSTIAFVNIFANYFWLKYTLEYSILYQAMEVKARQICLGIAIWRENKKCSFVHLHDFRNLFVQFFFALASVSEETYNFWQ